MKFNIYISDETVEEVYSMYGCKDYGTVETVLFDILDRYLNIEYFDPELEIAKSENYEKCPYRNENSMTYKMFDVDGINSEEHCVCDNSNYNIPNIS